jgi:small subunit ribosomal protein S4
MFERASALKGITGENLLMLCESRLDNVVFRLNLANTRDGARQLVSHKHITVNGDIVNIPSMTLKPGDKIGVRERSKSLSVISNALGSSSNRLDWLSFDAQAMVGVFISSPHRAQIPENIKEQLIVELYSK